MLTCSSDAMLNCGLHLCPQRCHQLSDHSNIKCEHMLQDKCSEGHERSWKCHEPPRECGKCEAETRRKQKELQRILRVREKRAREEREHSEHMAKLDVLLSEERERLREEQLSRERALAVQQKQRDLADAQAMKVLLIDPLSNTNSKDPKKQATNISHDSAKAQPSLWQNNKQTLNSADDPVQAQPTSPLNPGKPPSKLGKLPSPDWTIRRRSRAKEDWEHQKAIGNSRDDDIDSLMEMIGLEEVKLQILKIKARIEVSKRQNADSSKDRLNVSFLGNPGTGNIFQPTLYCHRIVYDLTDTCACQVRQRSLVYTQEFWQTLMLYRVVVLRKQQALVLQMMALLALRNS